MMIRDQIGKELTSSHEPQIVQPGVEELPLVPPEVGVEEVMPLSI
jgi:hypothetical protein